MQVFLIRHPRPTIPAGICYGQLDVECEDPAPIAARLRHLLPAGTPVISSPLRRARGLAEALDPNVRIDARLCEIHFGDWEGQGWDAIDRSALDAWAADVLNHTPPNGESVSDLQRRVLDFADWLEQQTLPNIAIVAHAGVLRVLVGRWRQLPAEVWTQLPFEFGGLTEVKL